MGHLGLVEPAAQTLLVRGVRRRTLPGSHSPDLSPHPAPASFAFIYSQGPVLCISSFASGPGRWSEVQYRGGPRPTEPSSVWYPGDGQRVTYGEAGPSDITWGDGGKGPSS